MSELTANNWAYLHSKPLVKGRIKQQFSDFKVFENLSFEPSGNGEHSLLQIEKTGLNTAFVAEQLAKFAGLPLRNVSYAGRKDKFATTTQWFGVYYANKPKVNWDDFSLEGLRIKSIVQNDRKLRTGAIRSNHFDITLRSVINVDEAELYAKIEAIKHLGVPNYYGAQRFGELVKPDGTIQLGGNLAMAEKLLQGEEIRNRNKRSMAISALRSWLFNHCVSERIRLQKSQVILDGDALQLAGTNSFFVHSGDQSEPQESVSSRLARQDVFITSPLWGKGELQSQNEARKFEQNILSDYSHTCEVLARLGLEQQRRAILLFPQDFKIEIGDNSLRLRFSLPSGCFATSVVREIADVSLDESTLTNLPHNNMV